MGNTDSYKAYVVLFRAPFGGGERIRMFGAAPSADAYAKSVGAKRARLPWSTDRALFLVKKRKPDGVARGQTFRERKEAVALAALSAYEEGGQWAVYRFDGAGRLDRPKLVYMSGECRAAAPSAPDEDASVPGECATGSEPAVKV